MDLQQYLRPWTIPTQKLFNYKFEDRVESYNCDINVFMRVYMKYL